MNPTIKVKEIKSFSQGFVTITIPVNVSFKYFNSLKSLDGGKNLDFHEKYYISSTLIRYFLINHLNKFNSFYHKNNYIRKYDYIFVILSIISANMYSVTKQREHIVCSLTLCTMFLYFYSDYYKKKKHETKSVICHSFTYLLGNIGVLIAYS